MTSWNLDCGDNSCLFAEKRTGMRTNGGCCCFEDLSRHELAQQVAIVARYISDLRKEIKELKEEVRHLEHGGFPR